MDERLAVSLRSASVRRGGRWVLSDITLDLEPGERWALLGENGAGKTQLLKLIAGDVWPTPTGHGQRIYRLGRASLTLEEAKGRIAYLGAELQDKYLRYGWDLPLEELIATGLHRTDLLLGPIRRSERRRVHALIEQCGLEGLARRRFTTLSHGEQRLALLARALAPMSDWLLLDEIYNGLDGRARTRIDRMLHAGARHLSWVVAAHRGADVPAGTRAWLELEGGQVRARGSFRRGELDSLRRGAQLLARPGSRRRAHRALSVPARRARPLRRPRPLHRPPVRRPMRIAPALLRLHGVDLYVEGHRVLQQVDWTVREGEHWAILGDNGAGKSTLLRLLYGDLAPAFGGRLERRHHPPGTPIDEWKRSVGYVSPQLQTDYLIEVSLLELVASGRHASIGLVDALDAADRAAARRWLAFFGLSRQRMRRPRELSYGQLRRALIARALCAGARLLLLDEPLTGLDVMQRARMKRLLERLMRSGVTVIMVVHHPEDLPQGITHALHLAGGHAHVNDLHSAN
ncbi:MAG TPA: ATP-binding cassette domain-containing protein [Steroidobacteraceae bacterium]|nr:ATP-binding cassette domain-containing protein [Steroidobacteraceae bacterium]